MTEQVLQFADANQMFPNGGLILCAVSGGIDSICLLHLLWTLAARKSFSLAAAHYNHQLRGAESQRDQEFVESWCRKRSIPLTTGSGPVAQTAQAQGRGIEETARRLRYAFLQKTAQELGADRIATAHTADDNAETLLLHLIRGAGLQGLSGIPPRRENIIRPLLGCTRRQVEDYCTAHGLTHVEDSSNGDPGYTRNFLRLQVMPLLRQMNPKAVETISAAAGRLREDHLFLDGLAEQQAETLGQLQGKTLRISAKELAALPPVLQVRAVRKLLERAGGGTDCTSRRLEDVIHLCQTDNPSARLDLPGLTARREYEALIFSPSHPSPQPEQLIPTDSGHPFIPHLPPVCVCLGGTTCFGDWLLHCRRLCRPPLGQEPPGAIYLDWGGLVGDPILRSRQTGDQIKLPGRPTKKIKKLMIDAKVPNSLRAWLPVLADGAGVLALAGFGPEERRQAQPGQMALEIIWERVSFNGTYS